MKTFILCGGFGTRLDHEGKLKPKPMVNIGNLPILMHIINYYTKFKITEFVLCLGYKSHFIINYFLKKGFLKIKNKKYIMIEFKIIKKKIKIFLVKTGINTGTAGRIKIAYKKLNLNEDFMMTYGDGLSNISIKKLISYHYKKNKLATLSAVFAKQRYGILKIKKGLINLFDNSKQRSGVRINGGFFVLSKKIPSLIKNYKSYFEDTLLKKLIKNKELAAYKHNGFWHSLDNLKDKNELNKIWKAGRAPWKIKN